jgi:hypothetical protein
LIVRHHAPFAVCRDPTAAILNRHGWSNARYAQAAQAFVVTAEVANGRLPHGHQDYVLACLDCDSRGRKARQDRVFHNLRKSTPQCSACGRPILGDQQMKRVFFATAADVAPYYRAPEARRRLRRTAKALSKRAPSVATAMRLTLAGKIDAILKLSVVASVLLASPASDIIIWYTCRIETLSSNPSESWKACEPLRKSVLSRRTCFSNKRYRNNEQRSKNRRRAASVGEGQSI